MKKIRGVSFKQLKTIILLKQFESVQNGCNSTVLSASELISKVANSCYYSELTL